MKIDWSKFKNPGTIISICSLIGLLLIQFGIEVDMVWLDTTIKLFCSLGVVVGILNTPDTPGIDLPLLPKEEKKD